VSDFDLFGDYEPEQPATLEEETPRSSRRSRSNRETAYNAISLFFIALTIAVCIGAALLVQNPLLPFNPFPPQPPAPTPTLINLEEQASGDVAAASTDGSGAEAAVPIETATPTLLPPTATSSPAPTATGGAAPAVPTNTPSAFAFTLQNETLAYIPYTGTEGCDYLAIAGQVFDAAGDPLTGIPVVVEGDEFFEGQLAFSGNAPDYGPSGYEVYLNDSPYEGEFTVKLVSETGFALSEEVVVRTHDSCDENVVIVNFVQNQETP
jgi:hypothetical protein